MAWGLTPHEIHSLVGCSSEIGMFQQLAHINLIADFRQFDCRLSSIPGAFAAFSFPENVTSLT